MKKKKRYNLLKKLIFTLMLTFGIGFLFVNGLTSNAQVPSQTSNLNKITTSTDINQIEVNKLGGSCYVRNQLIKEFSTNMSDWNVNSNLSTSYNYDTNTLSVEYIGSFNDYGYSINENINMYNNHKYLLHLNILNSTSSISFRNNYQIFNNYNNGEYYEILNVTQDSDYFGFGIYEQPVSISKSYQIQNLFLIDLTKWFGSNDFIPNNILTTPSTWNNYYKGTYPYIEEELNETKTTQLTSGINTLSISSAIQNINGYGWGVNQNCYNYIDYTNNKFVQNVGKVDLGSLDWSYDSSQLRFGVELNNAKAPYDSGEILKYLVSIYTTVSANYFDSHLSEDMLIRGGVNGVGYIWIRNLTYTNANDFKNAMSGVMLYYELATPIETDITNTIIHGNGAYKYNYLNITNSEFNINNTNKVGVPIEYTEYINNENYLDYLDYRYNALTNQYNNLYQEYQDLQQTYNTYIENHSYTNTQYTELETQYNNLQNQYNTLQQQYNLLNEQVNGFYNTYKLLFNNAKCYAINSLDPLYGKDIANQYANRNDINYEQIITIENNNINFLNLPSFYNYMAADYQEHSINEVYYVLYTLESYSDYSLFLDDLGENLTDTSWVNEISVLYANGFIETGNAQQFNNTSKYTYTIKTIENNPIIAFRVSHNINPNRLATYGILNLETSAMINNAYYQQGVSSLNEEIANKNALIESLNTNINTLRIQYNTLREQYDLISNKPLDLNMRNLIWYIAETPFTSFKTIWNVDFLGLNIASFVTGLFSVFIVLFIIKKIFK